MVCRKAAKYFNGSDVFKVRCGRNAFATNLLLSLTMKEFLQELSSS